MYQKDDHNDSIQCRQLVLRNLALICKACAHTSMKTN